MQLPLVPNDKYRNWGIQEGVFTKEECEKVVRLFDKLPKEKGGIHAGSKEPERRDSMIAWLRYGGEGLLAKFLLEVRDANPLVLLDSAGGTGWLEFTALRQTMGDRPYVLLLDDVHHVKHYRSLEHVRRDPSFEIIALDEHHGWMLARHGGRALR